MNIILYSILLVSLIQASLSSDFDSAWTQTVHKAQQGARETDKTLTKTYDTTKRDTRRLVRSVSQEATKLSKDSKLELDAAKKEISAGVAKGEDDAKADYEKTIGSLKSALNQTKDDLDHFSVEVRNKLEKLKKTTEQKLAKIAKEAGNKLEMGISKGLIDYQAKEEVILEKVTILVRRIFEEVNPKTNCKQEDYIQCVIHRNLTFQEGLRSQCATEYGCQIGFLKNKNLRQKLDQAEIGIRSLENQSSQNAQNELENMQKRDKAQKSQEVAAKNQIKSQFLNKARKIMIDGGCQDTCVDACTSSMKQYLTNSCNKCKCKAQNNLENIEAVQIMPKRIGYGTDCMVPVVLGMTVVAGIGIQYMRTYNDDLEDQYIKI